MDNEMATPTETMIQFLQYVRECFLDDECTDTIARGLNTIRQQAKMNYEHKIRIGRVGDTANYELFKMKLFDALLIERDVARATHWYGKWDEAVNNVYEDMTTHPDKYIVRSINLESGKEVDKSKNSRMLDQCGKIFAEEKNLFQFLLTII
jgi:hypothetical protein